MCENTHGMYGLRKGEESSGNIWAADRYEAFLIWVLVCTINYAARKTDVPYCNVYCVQKQTVNFSITFP